MASQVELDAAHEGGDLTTRQLLGYVAYAIPVTALPAAVVNLIPPYYAEVLGLPLASIGMVFMSLRIFDAFTDPLMGWLVDRRPFRQAHKPWVLGALPVFLLSVGLLFSPLPDYVGIPYLFVAGFLTYSAYTVGLVTHQAWGAALARSGEELSRLFGLRELAVIAGILCVFLAPAIAEQVFDADLEGKVVASSLFVGASFIVCTAICLAWTPDERARIAPPSAPEPGSVRRLLTHPDFVLLALANFAVNFAMVALSVLSYFTAAYVFDSADRYGLGMTLYFVAAAFGMGVWMPMARRLGDRPTLVVAAVYLCVNLACLPLWLRVDFEARYLIFIALLGFGFGAGPYVIRAMVGRMANDYEARTGETVRGTVFAMTTLFDKLGAGVASGGVLTGVAAMGFEPSAEVSAEGVQALIIVGIGAPIAGFALVGICLLLYGRLGRPRVEAD